jgi:hypothetical protein
LLFLLTIQQALTQLVKRCIEKAADPKFPNKTDMQAKISHRTNPIVKEFKRFNLSVSTRSVFVRRKMASYVLQEVCDQVSRTHYSNHSLMLVNDY